jgi:TPR repeat protein
MNNIGLAYANGDGVQQDYAEAFNWWHQSAFLATHGR